MSGFIFHDFNGYFDYGLYFTYGDYTEIQSNLYSVESVKDDEQQRSSEENFSLESDKKFIPASPSLNLHSRESSKDDFSTIPLHEEQHNLNEEQQFNSENSEETSMSYSVEELILSFPMFTPLPRVQTEESFQNGLTEKEEKISPENEKIIQKSVKKNSLKKVAKSKIKSEILTNIEKKILEKIDLSNAPTEAPEAYLKLCKNARLQRNRESSARQRRRKGKELIELTEKVESLTKQLLNTPRVEDLELEIQRLEEENHQLKSLNRQFTQSSVQLKELQDYN